MDPIVLHFTPTEFDIIRATSDLISRKDTMIARFTFPALSLCIILVITLYYNPRDYLLGWLPVWLCLILFTVSILISPYRQKREIRSQHPEWLLPCTCEIDDREIVIRNSEGETHYYWKDIGEVHETKKTFYFLFLDKKRYMFFPKSSFESSQQMEQFRALWQRMLPPPVKV